jgi:negative regulator of genetic competence, sporulation and motility
MHIHFTWDGVTITFSYYYESFQQILRLYYTTYFSRIFFQCLNERQNKQYLPIQFGKKNNSDCKTLPRRK